MTKIKKRKNIVKILHINLSNKNIFLEKTDKYHEWLGGIGIGEWLLYKEVKPAITPYHPENRLIFGTGPLNGTLAPTSSRLYAVSKSPLNLMCSSSAGGFFAPELRFAGYDHIVIKGKSNKPVFILINDDSVKIIDAYGIWGKTTWEVDRYLKSVINEPKLQVLSIGPAGENLVRGACIMVNKNRALGRAGLGAIMGSKNLKAIAVRGTKSIKIACPKQFFLILDKFINKFQRSKATKLLGKYGTLFVGDRKNLYGGWSYKNFQDLSIPLDMAKKFSSDNLKEKYEKRILSCFSCPIGCDRIYGVDKGPYKGLETEGTQFEALAAFGAKLGIDDFSFVMKAEALCNQLGIDVDFSAGIIAWLMESHEKGLIEKKDLNGFVPSWGDKKNALKIIYKIAYREGIGDLLANGALYAANLLNKKSKYYVMNIKGKELYEPLRYAIGFALAACVSPRGGTHTTGTPFCETNPNIDFKKAKEVYKIDTFNKPLEWKGKAELLIYYEMLHRLDSCLGLCHYSTNWLDMSLAGFKELKELYIAATGDEITEEKMKRISLRIINIEKAFNLLHANLSKKDDFPPKRSMVEAVPTGPPKGFRLEKEKFENLLEQYYDLHNWDKKTSFPTRSCLEKLDLFDVASDLYKAGKLIEN